MVQSHIYWETCIPCRGKAAHMTAYLASLMTFITASSKKNYIIVKKIDCITCLPSASKFCSRKRNVFRPALRSARFSTRRTSLESSYWGPGRKFPQGQTVGRLWTLKFFSVRPRWRRLALTVLAVARSCSPVPGRGHGCTFYTRTTRPLSTGEDY